ncbi:SAM hydrolase/SAM-dependent halogenase family protein [Natrarchaeobius oligotrophus]|uniref:NAD operon protein n=1 Tax=Natrarchaeobius chitinivorans TaxID=1679083 RepID=A0A3N6MIX2_NATCH|nr:SAM-dependent chlorinase/fluorinase [Natrarchaeobius chitinivorans]RQH03228.1 NAD operon protein [Natrarchaeobius chitinivorans]
MLTLSSDFGTPYPAAMKGVILRRTDARLVDVAHDFPRQDVRTAAFWLREVLPYFPPAVHLVVVDPGVGTDRNALVLRAGDDVLVGPDNGVLVPAARRLAGGDDFETYAVDEAELEPAVGARGTRDEPSRRSLSGAAADSSDDDGPSRSTGPGRDRTASNTFHGRDVFAPAAAAVHETAIDALASLEFLEPVEEYERFALPTATIDGDRAAGEVLVVDDFGNAITNVPGRFLAGSDRIVADGDSVPVGETFAAVAPGDPLATIGSHGYVELDVNQGRGDEAFDLAVGDRVRLERP